MPNNSILNQIGQGFAAATGPKTFTKSLPTLEAEAKPTAKTTSESGAGDADGAMAHADFHNDLSKTICPDCHDQVRQVMYQNTHSDTTQPDTGSQGGR